MCYGCTMCDACGKVTRMKQIMGYRNCPTCGREVPGFITECFTCGTELEYIEPGDATLLAYKGDKGNPFVAKDDENTQKTNPKNKNCKYKAK